MNRRSEPFSNCSHNSLIDRIIWLTQGGRLPVDLAAGPSFQFYPNDLISDRLVMEMSWAARGAHVHCMCLAWAEHLPCSLPASEKQVDRTLRGLSEDDRESVLLAWVLRDGRIWQPGLIKSYLIQVWNRLKKIEGGYAKSKNAEGLAEIAQAYRIISGEESCYAPAQQADSTCKQGANPCLSSSSSSSSSSSLKELTLFEGVAPPPSATVTTPPPKVSRSKSEPLPEIPPALDTAEFREAWGERLVERSQKGAKGRLTASQVGAQFRQLAKVAKSHGIAVAVECVVSATAGGWQGVVFEDKLPGANGNGKNGHKLGAFGITPGVMLAERREMGKNPEMDAELEEDRKRLIAIRERADAARKERDHATL